MDMMETIELKDIESQVKQVFRELLEAARLNLGSYWLWAAPPAR